MESIQKLMFLPDFLPKNKQNKEKHLKSLKHVSIPFKKLHLAKTCSFSVSNFKNF